MNERQPLLNRKDYLAYNNIWSWRRIVDTLKHEIYFLQHTRKISREGFEQLRNNTLTMLASIQNFNFEKDANKSKIFTDLINRRARLTLEFNKKNKQGQIKFYIDRRKKE